MAAETSRFSCSAILVAAGSSQRMGFDKLAATLAGQSVLQRTIAQFLAAREISEIIVVCPEVRWNQLDPSHFTKPVRRVDGGKDRQQSVMAGLAALDDGVPFAAVHDGARPLVTTGDIDRCVVEARQHRAAALARRVTETLKRSDSCGFTTEGVARENLWFMETPQIFETQLLVAGYAEVTQRGLTVTDEVSVMDAVGFPVKLIESSEPNLKITTPGDIALAQALLS